MEVKNECCFTHQILNSKIKQMYKFMCTTDWCGCTNSYSLLMVKFVQIYTLGVGLFVHEASFWSDSHDNDDDLHKILLIL